MSTPDGSGETEADEILAVDVVLKLGALLLSAGSPTDDVERSMRVAAASVGLERATAAVTFGTITLSYFPGPGTKPITALYLVPERVTDYRRLSAAARLVADLRAGTVDLRRAAEEVDRIGALSTSWPEPLTSLAQAGSAAASTLLFGGSAVDALATLLIGVLVEPILARLDRSGLPPFFRSLIGPFVSSLLVAIAVAVGAPISGALVLTGSLLRFLPGAALVAGMRDLIDQSIISGSARLAEALFLGAAVASGTALGIAIAGQFGVFLEVAAPAADAGQAVAQVVAAGFACGFWAVRLGEPRFALLGASVLGAVGWAVYLFGSSFGTEEMIATALAGLAVGSLGRILSIRADTPVVLWIVPASLPLLPGLLIVNGMLAPTPSAGIVQLTTAVTTALALGAAVAFGDIVVQTLRHVRDEIIEPVIVHPIGQVVQSGIQAVTRPRPSRPDAERPSENGPEDGPADR